MTTVSPELIEDIELSFQLLEFSIRTMCYAELHKFDIELFGQDLQLNLNEENVLYRRGKLSKAEHIICTAQMSVGAAFAATAISMDCALENHNDIDQRIHNTKRLIQAVRNAFSHGIANPRWYVKPHRCEVIKLGHIGIPNIDLSALNGNTFKYSDIGGFAAWYRIKNFIIFALNDSANTT